MGMDLPANSRELLTAVVPRLGPSEPSRGQTGPLFFGSLGEQTPDRSRTLGNLFQRTQGEV
jgi:hypothetical protein